MMKSVICDLELSSMEGEQRRPVYQHYKGSQARKKT